MSMADINAAATALNGVRDAYLAKKAEIDAAMGNALANFNAWRSNRDVIGAWPSREGTRKFAIFQGFLYSSSAAVQNSNGGFAGIALIGTTTNVNIHFKMPYTIAAPYTFRFEVRGWCYGMSAAIDSVVSGFVYPDLGGIIGLGVSGTNMPHAYIGTDGFLYVRLTFASSFLTTIIIDGMDLGNGLPNLGQIIPILTASTVGTL